MGCEAVFVFFFHIQRIFLAQGQGADLKHGKGASPVYP